MITRRNLIAAGATAGAVSLLSPVLTKVAVAQTGSAQTGSVSGYLSVTPPSDPSFVSQLNKHFPGLLRDPYFQKIQSHAVLISNVSDQTISAYSTHWKVTTTTGGYETIIRHYFHPLGNYHQTAHPGVRGNKARFTGNVPVHKAGTTRLVTPYFNWSPNFYRKNPTPNWRRILSENASRQFFLYELSKSTGVQVSVDAVIVNRNTLIGPDIGNLGMIFRVSRHAEHDVALATRYAVAGGASRDQVKTLLKEIATRSLPAREPANHRVYREVQQRQARVLLRRLNGVANEQFLRTLKYLASQPKTTT